uniref:UBP-type domain-containing protein n=1 Tax=Heliothis virescens TaxID=7102 RepID=A0A2A4K9K1_HELVI
MSTPPPTQARRSSGESKKVTPPASSIVTRNGARKAKIQTRAMSAGAKPSALVIAAKRKAQQKKKHGFDTELRDHYQIAMDSKTKVKGPTGLVTEPRMAEHRCLWDDQYPECPERLTSIIERCHELNLIEQCKQYPPRAATKEEVCVLHSPSVYDMMETTHQNNDLNYLEELSAKYDAVYIHPSTHELALLAAGSTIDLVDRIVSGEVQNGAALVRPPGHHAMRAEPCGYCFYNNVALAAKHAIDHRGVNRILIVDWDVHHGQATQQMFYNDPRVVYFSIHRYEHGAFWPNLRQSNFQYVGAGRGKGYNFNVPLNKTGMTDGDYLAIWHQLLLPMAFESTHELALLAAGSTIDLVDRIVSGEVQNGAALVRPPGHHAMRAEPCGYCFYNNVALAAKHAIDHRGVNRILIVDWDVHHGQATQQMFYNDPRVVYFSIHRYEHGAFWPNLRQSNFQYVGAGRGKGYNFNVPLNKTGMTDGDYLAIWHQLLLPMAFEYQPELIIISAGYDAAYGCPEGEMQLTPAVYGHLTQALMSVCPRVCAVLEGGYCVASLAEGAALTLRTLLGHAPPKLEDVPEPNDEIRDTILNCIYAQKPHWNCYNFQPTYSITGPPNVCDGQRQKHTVTVRWEGDETRPDTFETRNCYPVQDSGTKRKIAERLNHLRLVTDLTIPQHAVGYIYDTAMLKHKNVCEPGHVECPERIMRIHERHRDFALLPRMRQLPPRAASDDDILAVHTEAHLNRLKELATTKLRNLNIQKEDFDSVYFHPDSLESAAVAAGCVLQMVDAVLSNEVGSGVCVIRPPGHHADEEIPSGFCLLNNAATAAKYAIHTHGLNRVLILDWDVHHGNGTQRITYDDDKILYMSIHRYDHGSFFPHSKDADHTAVGEGKGEGFNVNVPWNKRGMGDTEYLTAFTQVILPIAYEYNPQLVIVSAGFDACVGDPLGGCKVTPECYGRMTQLLRGLAGGRVILCLEGGYNITSISYAMTMCSKALLGDPILHHYDPKTPCHWAAIDSINDVISTHKQYWKCLKFQVALPSDNVLEPPLPSRGLVIEPSELEVSTCSEDLHNESAKSTASHLESSLEASMSNLNLNIEKKCSDGIHCGTDDEDEKPKSSKSPEASASGTSRPPDSKKEQANPIKPAQADPIKPAQAGSSAGKKPTLVEYLAENMQSIADGDMFAVIPLQWCPHLDSLYTIPDDVKFEQGVKCVECDHTEENWVCLHCYVTACARSINGHMQAHCAATGHALVLSLVDLSVWCNICDAYVDNSLLYDAKNNAHRCKFGEDMPWYNVLEPPLPSRGLVIEPSELEVSTCSEDLHNESAKSTASHLESSLEASMSNLNLNIEKKCSDGIHCGTDDEDEKPKSSKSPEASASGTSRPPDSKKEQANPIKPAQADPIKPAQAGSSAGKKPTLVEYLAENMQSIADGDMFAVIPLQWCPHLDSLYTIPDDVKFEQGVKCVECDHTEENWVCLHCYVTACARSINGHMQAHCAATGHALVLSLVDLSVWCNICDAYVDNSLLYDAKNNAHRCKFGEDMPWCYKTDIQMQ